MRDRFTNGKPRIATDDDINGAWSSGFRCYLCGYHFQLGDYWRWQFMGGEGGYINFLVCKTCDTPDVIQKFINLVECLKDIEKKFNWYFK